MLNDDEPTPEDGAEKSPEGDDESKFQREYLPGYGPSSYENDPLHPLTWDQLKPEDLKILDEYLEQTYEPKVDADKTQEQLRNLKLKNTPGIIDFLRYLHDMDKPVAPAPEEEWSHTLNEIDFKNPEPKTEWARLQEGEQRVAKKILKGMQDAGMYADAAGKPLPFTPAMEAMLVDYRDVVKEQAKELRVMGKTETPNETVNSVLRIDRMLPAARLQGPVKA